MNDPSPIPSSAVDATWREIEQLVDELSQLAETESSPRRFHAALLERTLRALAATEGAVWVRGADQVFRLEHPARLPPTLDVEEDNARLALARLLEAASLDAQATAVAPLGVLPADETAANPTGRALLLGPVIVDGQCVCILEIAQRPDVSPEAQRGHLRLLGVMCDVASQFHRNRQLDSLRQRETRWREIERFAENVHQSLDLDATAYTIANEGRRLVGCDRLSVAASRRGRGRVRAISGVDTVQRRSNVVRRMEKLVTVVLAAGEPLWSDGGTEDLPPQLEAAVQAFMDESHCRWLGVVPVLAREAEGREGEQKPVGAVVIERFEAPEDGARDREAVDAVCRHAAAALRHALAHPRRLFGRMAALPGAGRPARAALALAAAVAAVLALIFLPATLEIEARGRLQPKVNRQVFAPGDGVVRATRVEHADHVAAGDVLAELHDSDLDFEFARVLGEMQTSRKQLESLQASRLQAERTGSRGREEYEELTAREEELKTLLESLAQQHKILREQQSQLTVLSPIDGQVLSWNVKESLDARPVRRGQLLMTVADLSGPWILKLRVPDRHIGYVADARRDCDRKTPVTFLLATDPGATYRGTVDRVAMASEIGADDRATVLVTVDVPHNEIAQRRPGAEVIGKIDCGRRSLGYVWFHDLIEALRTRLLF